MQTITLASKTELAKHEAAIEALFGECFGDRLSLALWRWAYLDNPHGEPYVSLCYDADRLVGHYAMIPMPLSASQGRLNSYLSMTTMVAASHRQHGLFVKLAEATYERARADGVDFVMGFPNEMSTPGFRKRLNWDLPPSDYVASVTKSQLLDAIHASPLLESTHYALDLRSQTTRAWRLARPGAQYHWVDGLAYKAFGDELDLLAFDDPGQLRALPEDRKINLLLPADYTGLAAFKAFDYQFGGRSLASAFNASKIVRQMALSDLF